MNTYIPKKPSGVSSKWMFLRWVWDYLAGGMFPIKGDGNIKVEWLNGFYRISSKPAPAGGSAGGWDWMYPTHKELDPTLPYTKGKVAYISSLNTLVTAGMTDLVSNATATSCPGLWLCVQNVSAASGGKFNVPVYPYIAGATAKGGTSFLMDTTAPSGSPLIGDLDLVDTTTGNPSFYWHYLGKVT